jgi:hypothetical protein
LVMVWTITPTHNLNNPPNTLWVWV